MNGTEPRWAARRYVEERIDEVRYELAMCEACGSTGALGDLEEELLEELTELEYALVTGDLEPYVRWALPFGREVSQ